QLLTNWDQYLAPAIVRMLPVAAHTFTLVVGVIEIVAAALVAVKPRFGAYVVTAWLWGIIVNLLLIPGYYDIALRDFGLSLGALGPNLGNIATEAARIVRRPDYHGRAKDAAGYIRESIVDPNAYIVPGPAYRHADGQSVMPKTFGQTLTPAQLEDLVVFLLTRR